MLPKQITTTDRYLIVNFMNCLSPETKSIIFRASIIKMPSGLVGKSCTCCLAPK